MGIEFLASLSIKSSICLKYLHLYSFSAFCPLDILIAPFIKFTDIFLLIWRLYLPLNFMFVILLYYSSLLYINHVFLSHWIIRFSHIFCSKDMFDYFNYLISINLIFISNALIISFIVNISVLASCEYCAGLYKLFMIFPCTFYYQIQFLLILFRYSSFSFLWL